jgi:putative redox protein
MQLTVDWKGGLAFEATPPSGHRMTFDAIPDVGGSNLGPTPVEALCASAAACSAIDVISILTKKRQTVTGYRLEVEWVRADDGNWPRPVRELVIRHILSGEDLDPEAVARSVELSDTKYCTAISTLRTEVSVTSEWKIEGQPQAM